MAESLTIELNSGSKSIIKIGFLLRSVFILFFIISLAFLGLHFFKSSFLAALICFAVCFILFIIFFRMLNAAFFKEQLIITKESITYINKNLSNTKKNVFDLNEIKYFGFADQQYTKHAMDNPIVDFTGLATGEKELQYVIDEGNIKLETDTKSIKFGKNMPSWDVEELIEKIENFTGQKYTKPRPGRSTEDLYKDIETELDPDAEVISETETKIEQDEEQTESLNTNFERYSYSGDYGELIIEQQNDLPAADDKAFLNGELAPTGKYQIGDKQFVFVSNGFVYAVRL